MKIHENKINKHFSYKDIEKCIKEAALLDGISIPHTESVVNNLLKYYFEHPTDERFKYALTDFAKKFIKLIDNKLFSPYTKFPLRKTFQKLADFKSSDIQEIDDFQRWYEFNFEGNSGTVILDHLEALKDYINKAIEKLNIYINQEEQSAVKIAEKVALSFDRITAKSDEIKDTLLLSNELDIEIDNVVAYFLDKKEALPDFKNEQEKTSFKELKKDYDIAVSIKNKVDNFFVQVDYKLGQLIDRSAYASTQLIAIQENFRNKSKTRINIKRLLKFTLKEASFSKSNWIELPNQYPIKTIIEERFKHIGINYYEGFGIQKSYVLNPVSNEKQIEKETVRLKKELTRQENTAKWLRHYKQLLHIEKGLDFTSHFYDIIDKEKDSLIAVKVGFELLQYARNLPEYVIEIDKEMIEPNIKTDVNVWKMKITKKGK